MSHIDPEVKAKLDKMFADAKEILSHTTIRFNKIGIFGSYARGDYRATSDIDLVIIVDKYPNEKDLINLRGDLYDIGCDLVVLHQENFDSPKSVFQEEVKQDFIEVNLHE